MRGRYGPAITASVRAPGLGRPLRQVLEQLEEAEPARPGPLFVTTRRPHALPLAAPLHDALAAAFPDDVVAVVDGECIRTSPTDLAPDIDLATSIVTMAADLPVATVEPVAVGARLGVAVRIGPGPDDPVAFVLRRPGTFTVGEVSVVAAMAALAAAGLAS